LLRLLDHLNHFVVGLFGFLDLFCHGLLVGLVFLYQVVGILYLYLDVSNSAAQSVLGLFSTLVNKDATNLLEYFSI
jgi:hypothetical protein